MYEIFNHLCRTANGLSPVTFAIAAEEANGVNVSQCSKFVITGTCDDFTAKDLWEEMKQVSVCDLGLDLQYAALCIRICEGHYLPFPDFETGFSDTELCILFD